MFRVTLYGEPVLRTQGRPVTTFDDELQATVDEMIETMYEANGIGLAAQQVGLDLQLCVVDVMPEEGPIPFQFKLDGAQPDPDQWMPFALCNPKVTILPGEEEVMEEGCLSFPEVRGEVSRPSRIEVSFQDTNGDSHCLQCDGLLARCILHEVDHLNGVLFIDHMSEQDLKKADRTLKLIKKRARKLMDGEPA